MVDVSLTKRSLPTDLDTESSSFFQQRFEYWRERELSQSFLDFAREARPLCYTLPLVIHHKAKLVELLLKHVHVKESICKEAIVE